MATNFDIVSYALKINNNDLLLDRRLLKEALGIMDESLAYKKSISASWAADLLSLSRPHHYEPVLTAAPGAFHIAGGNIDFSATGFGVFNSLISPTRASRSRTSDTHRRNKLTNIGQASHTLLLRRTSTPPQSTAESSTSAHRGTWRIAKARHKMSFPKPRTSSPSS